MNHAGWFQSAPDPKAGREWLQQAHLLNYWVFQSAPDPKAGREMRSPQAQRSGRWFQSAPDPKAGRERRCRPWTTRPAGFNPLPTRRPGERPG